jgi:hypothetical protein
MLVSDLHHLDTLDRPNVVSGAESTQGLFSFYFGRGSLLITDQGNTLYNSSFPSPFSFSILSIPGTVSTGTSESLDGTVKASYLAIAGQGIQNNQPIAVFFSSSSSVLSL